MNEKAIIDDFAGIDKDGDWLVIMALTAIIPRFNPCQTEQPILLSLQFAD